jgi:TRAP-type C4-dicarboxylate transport system substrate-binding protein
MIGGRINMFQKKGEKMVRVHASWIGIFIMVIAVIFSSLPLCAADKKYVDPWDLERFVTGGEVPPDNMAILMKWATSAPEGTVWWLNVNAFGKDLERESKGFIKVRLYGGGVMGDEADTIRKLKMKQLHLLGLTNMGSTLAVPETCVFELPFLFDWEPDLYYNGKACEIDYILKKMGPSIAKLTEQRGFQYLGTGEACEDFIFSPVPLNSTDDFKKLNFWYFRGDRVRDDVNKVFGFNKTVSAELFDAIQPLSTKMMDSVYSGWYVPIALQWWPHLKYATDYPLFGHEVAMGFVDKKMFDLMEAFMDKWGPKYGYKNGKEFREMFLTTLDEGLSNVKGDKYQYMGQRHCIREGEKKAKKELISRGAIKEVHFPDAELEKLKQKSLPLYTQLADKEYPKWLLDEILKYREEYRTLKKQGKLDNNWYEKGILPGGNEQYEAWRK